MAFDLAEFTMGPVSLPWIVVASMVQISNNLQYDAFTEIPVSLVLLSLIFIDVTERIRQCRLTGRAHPLRRDAEIPSSMLTNMEPLSHLSPLAPTASATGHILSNREQNGANAGLVPGSRLGLGSALGPVHGPGPNNRFQANGTVPGLSGSHGRQFSVSGMNSHLGGPTVDHIPPYLLSGPLRFLCASDARADVFMDGFVFWLDTVEMVRVAGHPGVYYSGWVFPIYIFSYLSVLRIIVMPHSPLLSTLGVLLQDFPFLFVRIALIAIFGFVTPLLYLVKNLMVSLAFIYFNFMTKLKIFNTERLF